MAETGSKSKTLSDRRSSSKLLKPPTFFLDRALGKRKVADALRATGAPVEVHEDHFPSDARDEDWLSEVGKRGWVVLTKDRHIRYRASEKRALMRAGIAVFVLTSGNLTGDDMATAFVAAMPRIQKLLRSLKPPFIAKVTRSGTVTLLDAPRHHGRG
jgi:predicted nuclease of predicted toxin-antitoxin system